MEEKLIKNKLLGELNSLKDKKYGFLKAGLPRFDRLFGRDSLISAWQLLDCQPAISKATLTILAQLQGVTFNDESEEEPGKILHETDFKKKCPKRSRLPFPYYGSIDATELFLILFSFYFKKTRDKKFLGDKWSNILAAVKWIENYGDKDKDLFLEYQRKTKIGLFHQGWKDSFSDHLKIEPPVALVEVQGYQYSALKETAFLAETKKDFKIAARLRKRAEKLKERFNRDFWMEDKNYFCLALNGAKQQREAITSNPGHLLFSGIIEKAKIGLVVRRLFQPDLWTSYGIRTHSTKEPDFDPKSYHLGPVWPHDNWLISQGLEKQGFKKEEQKIKKALLRAYGTLGFLPEYYGVVDGKITLNLHNQPCYPQSWATGALFNFLHS